jgi:hypothetical protein
VSPMQSRNSGRNAGTYLTRRDGLTGSQARLRLPTACVVHRLTGAIETALARAPFADREWGAPAFHPPRRLLLFHHP